MSIGCLLNLKLPLRPLISCLQYQTIIFLRETRPVSGIRRVSALIRLLDQIVYYFLLQAIIGGGALIILAEEGRV
jgi:hypothetical protein